MQTNALMYFRKKTYYIFNILVSPTIFFRLKSKTLVIILHHLCAIKNNIHI